MRRILFSAAFVVLLLSVYGCSGSDGESVQCQQCGMVIKLPDDVQGAKIGFKDGVEESFCSMAHAIAYWNLVTSPEWDPDDPPVAFSAVDSVSKKFIDARDAYYVLGSDVESPMFPRSVIAFVKMSDAEIFAKKHGGVAMSYYEIALEDLESDGNE